MVNRLTMLIMKKSLYTILCCMILCCSAACSEEQIGDRSGQLLGLGGDEYVPTEIDEWIYDQYTRPYNMEVKYRWNRSELSLNNALVPVKEENVVPVMRAILRGWINPYEQVADPAFIRKLSPKKFVLVGSPKYSNGTITLGEAEGGRKIVIYRLNWYEAGNTDVLFSVLKTCHHEFGHTMHQAVKYPQEFENITASGYNSQWTTVSEKESIRLGFVSRYACASPNEDFSDMLAYICVYGRAWFDERVAQAQAYYNDPEERKTMTYDPVAALRSKESILVNYMKNVWNIDLYDRIEVEEGQEVPDSEKGLVTRVQEAIAAIQAEAGDEAAGN